MITILSVHVLNMCLIMQILFWKIKYIFKEKYRIQHEFSNLNKAIKQIEQESVLSGVEQSLIQSLINKARTIDCFKSMIKTHLFKL